MHIRLSLEIRRESLTVDEHVSSHHADRDTLRESVQQGSLSSPRFSHERRELSRSNKAGYIVKKGPVVVAGNGHPVLDILPCEYVGLRLRLEGLCCRAGRLLVGGGS